MTKQFFDELNQWQASCESRRSVTIQIGDAIDRTYVSAYAYDYDLKEGALVHKVNDLLALDLKAKKLRSLHDELAKLEPKALRQAA